MEGKELKALLKQVYEMKLSELFEEPSTFEDYADNDFVMSGFLNNTQKSLKNTDRKEI